MTPEWALSDTASETIVGLILPLSEQTNVHGLFTSILYHGVGDRLDIATLLLDELDQPESPWPAPE